MEKNILEKVKHFTASMYASDFQTLVNDYFYAPDVQEFMDNMLWMAEQMAPFGETAGLLKLFPNVNTLEELKKLSKTEFVEIFVSRMLRKLPKGKLQEMIDSTQVMEVEKEVNTALVTYTMKNVFEENGNPIESQMELILEDGNWYFKFKSGMKNFFQVYQEQINVFYEREKKDRPDLLEQSQFDDLESFKVVGYRNLEGQTVIEPRFREAHPFIEGLAAAKVFSKYGYIDKSGQYVIQPQFDKAASFEGGVARVAQRTDDWDWKYGLIDISGDWILPYTYDDIDEFCDGLARVKQNDKWGYLNKKGEVVIEIAYDSATDFEDGLAEITIETESEIKYMTINLKGEIL